MAENPPRATLERPASAPAPPDRCPPSCVRQTGLLLWKHTQSRRRQWVSTLVELLLPAALAILLVWAKGQVPAQNVPVDTEIEHRTRNSLDLNWMKHHACGHDVVLVSPKDMGSTFDAWVKSSANGRDLHVVPVADSDAMDAWVQADNYRSKQKRAVCVGIAFDKNLASDDISYALRFNGTPASDCGVVDTRKNLAPGFMQDLGYQQNWYSCTGFLNWQLVIDNFLVSQKYPSAPPSWTETYDFMPFPVPAYSPKIFLLVAGALLKLIFMVCFAYSVSRLVTLMVQERELKLREAMHIMGLRHDAYFLSWLTFYLGLFLVIATTMALVLWKGNLFGSSSFSLLLLFFWAYGATIITFGAVLSVPFSSAKTAAVISVILYVMAYFLSVIPQADWSPLAVSAMGLLPPVAFTQGVDVLVTLETAGLGLRSDTFGMEVQLAEGKGQSSMARVFIVLALDVVVYAVVFVVLDFFFHRSLQLRKQREETVPETVPQELCEGTPFHLAAQFDRGEAVRIRNLRKAYPGPRRGEPIVAVKGLTLDMFSGKLFCLLGHNGAGKTTTMGMLTGLQAPTAGSIDVFGLNGVDDIDAVRQNLSYCPQHDILFDSLTVWQHLELFGALRGLPKDAIREQGENLLRELKMLQKADSLVAALSGGMKRKLSVACAFLGEPKFVILDEPTSGMDPYSRRLLWQLLQRKKQGRVICLSTHYMDEAEALGDTIAIMAHGSLRCVGSSLFLKKAFGCGYTVTIVLPQEGDGDALAAELTALVPNADVRTAGMELALRLPFHASAALPALVARLEGDIVPAGRAQTFSVSVTKLEEVFMKVADGSGPPSTGSSAARPGEGSRPASGAGEPPDVAAEETAIDQFNALNQDFPVAAQPAREARLEAVATRPSALRQFRALAWKRNLYARRDTRSVCCILLVPGVLVLFGVSTMSAFFQKAIDLPGLTIAATAFNKDLPPQERNVVPVFEPGGISSGGKAILDAAKGVGWQPQVLKNTSQAELFAEDEPLMNALLQMHATAGPLRRLRGPPLGNSSAADCSRAIEQACPAKQVHDFDCEKCLQENAFAWGPVCYNAVGTGKLKPEDLKTEVEQHCFGNNPRKIAIIECASGDDLMEAPSPLLIETCTQYENYSLAMLGVANESRESHYGAYFFDNVSLSQDNVNLTGAIFGNQTAFHSFPLYLNLLHNAVFRALGLKLQVTVTNHPLPLTAAELAKIQSVEAFTPVTYIVLGMSFVPAGVVQLVVKERQYGVKHQQLVSGVGYTVYWVANLVADVFFYLVPLGLSLLCLFIFNVEHLISSRNFPAVLVLSLLYGPACMAFTYLFSLPFKQYTSAQNMILALFFVTGIIMGLVSYIMRNPVLGSGPNDADHTLQYFYRLFPAFCLCDGLISIPDTELRMNQNPILDKSPWAWDVAGADMCWLAVEGVVYMALVLVIENFAREPRIGAPSPPAPTLGDETARREAARVERTPVGDTVLRLESFGKAYGLAKPFWAVRKVSFAAQRGDVIGLLGLNGAGKTTTIRGLIGEVSPTVGQVHVNGVNIALDATRGRRNLGYCPQHDALLEPLTPREHLYLYAGIKGVAKSDLIAHVDALLAKLGLTAFADRPAGQLSGGNKRKLSVAVSLIGSPPLVFLDEPSCGMDPVARRFLWGVLRDVGSQAALLVTTHSMEEAEALSTRLVIMSFGEVVSVGSTTQITSQYGGAFEVNLRIRRPAEAEVHAAARALALADLEALLPADAAAELARGRGRDLDPALAGAEVPARALATWWASQDLGARVLEDLERVLPGVEVQETSGSLWWLRVPVSDGMSKPLGELEQLKKSQLLEEYSVAQASLEQIFNHLAATTQQKRAREEERAPANVSRTFSSHISDAAAPLILAQDDD